jgi:hypothetical protein
MAMSSTGTRKPRDVNSRAAEAIIENDKALIDSFKVFAEASNSTAGLAGPAVNNSPKTPAGNYLAREGDSMIGPLALGPPVDFTIEVDANNTIDVGPLNENVQYTSNIQLDDVQPNSSVLDIIANPAFDGQILVLRSFAPTVPYTISQGTLGNGGNIQTPDGNDITFGDLQMMVLIFDASLIIHANTGGTWRVLPGVGAGAISTTISTWKLPARAKSTVDIPNLVAASVDIDGVTLIQGDRVLLTEQTDKSENGLYIVGIVAAGLAPLTRPTDFDTDAKVLSETFVAIEEGTLFKNQLYHLTTDNPILIDVTNQTWTEFAPGTSGGPDMGGGEDGIDGAGFFVNDGRIAIGFDRVKRWEQINDFNYPNNFVLSMLYVPSKFNVQANGKLIITGRSTQSNAGFKNENYGTKANWVTVSGLTANHGFRSLTPNDDFSVIICVGGTLINQVQAIRRSTDRGDNWGTTAIAAGTYSFTDADWSSDDSQFVVVDSNSANQATAIWTSPDGNTWTNRVTPAPLLGSWIRVVYGNGLYIATGQSNTDVMTSPDGINWTLGVMDVSIQGVFSQMIFSPGQQKFIGVANPLPGPVPAAYITTNGINWTTHLIPNCVFVNDIVYAPDLSMYLVIGRNTTPVIPPIFWVSNDAKTWSNMPINEMRQNDGGIVGTGTLKGAVAYAQEWGYFFGIGADATLSSPYTAQSLFWRTGVYFNGQVPQ